MDLNEKLSSTLRMALIKNNLRMIDLSTTTGIDIETVRNMWNGRHDFKISEISTIGDALSEEFIKINPLPDVVTLDWLLGVICTVYKADKLGVKSRSRKSINVRPRQMFYKAAIEQGFSTKKIGRFLGRDHSTVVVGNQVATFNIETYDDVREEYEEINKQIYDTNPD